MTEPTSLDSVDPYPVDEPGPRSQDTCSNVDAELYYVTNRRHRGDDQWAPDSYGSEPSRSGIENLRFGKVVLPYDHDDVQAHLTRDCGFGNGDGGSLAKYLARRAYEAHITAFKERLEAREEDVTQPKERFGSTVALAELQHAMNQGCDILMFVHGFGVDWWSAVASALSLELMLNWKQDKRVRVVLFTWPSDGTKIPWWSYFSDRNDAKASADAVGRAVLKLRDYLIEARRLSLAEGHARCDGSIHLLGHSMGNYVLQCALRRIQEFSTGGKLPRVFDHIFMCAADVADDVFERGKPMERLPEMARTVAIYHNKGDLAMPISDYTKGNTDRLGWGGPSRPADLDGRVHAVDCSPIVQGLVEHSYYNCGLVNADIRQCIDDVALEDPRRNRYPVRHGWPNVWRMRMATDHG